jgi:hypothetical protein
MNVEIGAEAALFPEKEHIDGIAVAVFGTCTSVSVNGTVFKLKCTPSSNLALVETQCKCSHSAVSIRNNIYPKIIMK